MAEEQQQTTIPPATSRKLMALWHATQGALLAAQAANSVAQQAQNQWQSELRTVLEVMGLDPDVNWFINWDKGTIGPPPPEPQPDNTQMNGHAPYVPGAFSDLTGG